MNEMQLLSEVQCKASDIGTSQTGNDKISLIPHQPRSFNFPKRSFWEKGDNPAIVQCWMVR